MLIDTGIDMNYEQSTGDTINYLARKVENPMYQKSSQLCVIQVT